MLKLISRLLGAGSSTSSPAKARSTGSVPAAPAKPAQAGTPIYPPVDNGISFGNAEAVLSTQADMIRRLKLLAGLPAPDFERLYGGVLRSLAKHVDLLPASESGTHMGAGGLFRLALEIGFFSRQACEGVLFAGRAGVELRRDLEPRWRYATFLAGLCCELHRPLSRMIVVTENGTEWPVHRMGLSEWLESVGATRYFIRWVKEGDSFAGGSATLLATKIIPETSLQYLQEGHPNIIPAMLDAIVAEVSKSKDNQIAEILTRIRRKVIERDQVLAPQNYGKLTVGSQLEPHLVDAMRQLVANGNWTINVKKARLWFGKDGLYVVWRTAAKEIIEVLERGSVSGIPRDATTIAEVLLRAGVLVVDKNNDLYWKIKTPLSDNELVAVKLANPETLLVAIEENAPSAIDHQLAVGASVAATAGAQKASSQPPMAQPRQDTNESGHAPAPPAASPAPPPPPSPSASSVPPPPANTGAEPAQPAPKPTKVKPLPEEMQPGAITPVQESQAATLPEDVAARMTSIVREVVAQILKDYHSGLLADTSSVSDDGLAISLEQMGSYGVELTKVMAELHGLGWLHVNPENPKKKIHMAQIAGKAVQSAVFRRQVAHDLGFLT